VNHQQSHVLMSIEVSLQNDANVDDEVATNVTMELVQSQDLQIETYVNPAIYTLSSIFHNDIVSLINDYLYKPLIICVLMHDRIYPSRCIMIKIDMQYDLYSIPKDSSVWDRFFIACLMSSIQDNYKYPYSSEIMKNTDKKLNRCNIVKWERLMWTSPFYTPLTYQNRMGFKYTSLDTSVFPIAHGHNLAIGCSILLPYIQHNVWGVPENITSQTVFKFVKSPQKELQKNKTKWQKWKNSIFRQMVEHLKTTEPGFILICYAGEIFNYSIKFIEMYMQRFKEIKTSNK